MIWINEFNVHAFFFCLSFNISFRVAPNNAINTISLSARNRNPNGNGRGTYSTPSIHWLKLKTELYKAQKRFT